MGPMFVHLWPVNSRVNDLFPINAPFGQDFATGRNDQALSPELDPVTTCGRLMPNPIYRAHETSVGDGVTPLHRFPG